PLRAETSTQKGPPSTTESGPRWTVGRRPRPDSLKRSADRPACPWPAVELRRRRDLRKHPQPSERPGAEAGTCNHVQPATAAVAVFVIWVTAGTDVAGGCNPIYRANIGRWDRFALAPGDGLHLSRARPSRVHRAPIAIIIRPPAQGPTSRNGMVSDFNASKTAPASGSIRATATSTLSACSAWRRPLPSCRRKRSSTASYAD